MGNIIMLKHACNPSGKWDNNNVKILKPPGYYPGSGTGFLPGETFPGVI